MEKFRQLIAALGSTKRIALLSFLCLLFQAVLFYLGLLVCLSVIQPNSPTMFEENDANSFSRFMFLIVPLILFFSAVASSFSIFSMIMPKGFRRLIVPALIVGLIQTLPLVFTIPLSLMLFYFGLHFVFAAAPIYLFIIISVIVGNNLAFKEVK